MMRRFNWSETEQYWKNHIKKRGQVQWELDPMGLNNICYSGSPLWLNKYYARSQSRVFEILFRASQKDSIHQAKRRALDVGCGTGRWCKYFEEQGFEVHGIDLQEELIEENRKKYLGAGHFTCTSLQKFESSMRFDIISSVTVIQHNPFEEQEKLIAKLRQLIKSGGHLILLENIKDQDPHVFSHSIQEWLKKFKVAGFECLKIQRYDYNPILRTYHFLLRTMKYFLLSDSAITRRSSVQDDGTGQPVPLGKTFGEINGMIKKACIFIDGFFEFVLLKLNLPFSTVHCGFLFRAC